jgi:hypothetical protein
MTHSVLDYLVLVSAIRYRNQDNQWRELPFEGAYCTRDGRFYRRDGSTPHLAIREPLVVFGSKARCPCCQAWLACTPLSEVLHPDGRVLHVPHFAAWCRSCKSAGQLSPRTCPVHTILR